MSAPEMTRDEVAEEIAEAEVALADLSVVPPGDLSGMRQQLLTLREEARGHGMPHDNLLGMLKRVEDRLGVVPSQEKTERPLRGLRIGLAVRASNLADVERVEELVRRELALDHPRWSAALATYPVRVVGLYTEVLDGTEANLTELLADALARVIEYDQPVGNSRAVRAEEALKAYREEVGTEKLPDVVMRALDQLEEEAG